MPISADNELPQDAVGLTGAASGKYSHAYEITIQSRKGDPQPIFEPECNDLAVIVDAPAGLPIYEQTVASGVLVVVVREEAEILHARFKCPVALRRLKTNSAKDPYWTFNMEDGQDNVLIPKRILPPNQGWCLI